MNHYVTSTGMCVNVNVSKGLLQNPVEEIAWDVFNPFVPTSLDVFFMFNARRRSRDLVNESCISPYMFRNTRPSSFTLPYLKTSFQQFNA